MDRILPCKHVEDLGDGCVMPFDRTDCKIKENWEEKWD
jgi:hypothetical protein